MPEVAKMAVQKIRKFGDPILREVCKEITRLDEPVRKLAQDLVDTMREAPGVGLAAPQIGCLLRMIAIDVGDGPRVYVNPVLLDKSGGTVDEEGCLSLYDLRCPVKRFERVRLRGYDLQGNEVDLVADGLLSRVLQHEVDHLDGVLIIDRTSPLERKRLIRMINELSFVA